MESKTVEFFNKLSFTTLIGTMFLSLFFFIPYMPVTLDASKGFLISVGITLSLFFWLIARLGEGRFVVPKDKIILFAGSIPLVFLIASFFSSSKYVSFFGSGFELGTFGSMLIMFLLFFLSSIYFQSEKRIWQFFMLLFVGGVILAVFELLNIFVGFGFAPGLLQGLSSGNLVGSWNDFALLFGLIVLLSIFSLEFLRSKKLFRGILFFLVVSGLFFLAIINIPLVWIMVGVCAAIIFVYNISIQNAKVEPVEGVIEKKKFPFVALLVVFISFIFLVGSGSIGGFISKYISVSNLDVRPSITTTSQIAWQSIKHNPVFGTGPNTFVMDWTLWQPKAIAQTIFWNVDFVNGFSSLATFLVTTGIVGFAALILFIVTFLSRSVKALKIALQNRPSNYSIMATLITSIYSWVSIIFYTPNIIMFVIAFASSGMLIGILVYNQSIQVKSLSFLNDPRNSFFAILGLMVLMIATLSTTYLYAEKFTSIIYFSKGSTSTGTIESLAKSERMLSNALSLDQNDIYYRTLSQIYLAEIRVIIADKTISEDTLKSSVQQLVSSAEASALAAISRNPKQYINHVNLGNVYSSFASLGIEKSYDNAVAAYSKAQALAPNNPSILLARASLEVENKNTAEARNFIDQALALKVNYTDALFLLAQIETNEGNITGAIKQAERAAELTPNDATIFFRLGLLRYNNSDYSGAVSAFEKAVILDTNYLNARFFLGQAYQKVGRSSDALVQFNLLAQVLPDNQDVKDAIDSLSKVNTTPAPEAVDEKTEKTLPAKQ